MIRRKIFLFGFVLLISICIGVWYTIFFKSTSNNLLVSFLNIGQGDAIYIRAPSGVDVLIDAGGDTRVLSELSRVMSSFDKKINIIVATNPDKDHIGGFIPVFKKFKVDKVLVPATTNSTQTYNDFLKYKEEEGAENIVVMRGMDFVLDEKNNISISILFPDRDVSKESSNNGSIVAKLQFGKTCLLLQGDAPREVERHLLGLGESDLHCQILKAGHHGSRTSSDPSYIKAVNPDYFVISSGKNNRYGHPHKEVLEIMDNLGISVLRTDTLGRITFVSDGVGWKRVN